MLGVAYKPNIDDMRESPALHVIKLLEQKGAVVKYHDPFVPQFDHDGMKMSGETDLMSAVKSADVVVVVTNHSAYDFKSILKEAKLIVDGRNALGAEGKNSDKVVRL